ncbi:MAG TPA: hypothetical protein VKQ30_18930 [Ktedonobacterales bacterium]|nr:hypothetical protein [Ktedonobacterales bacterium]
MASTSTPATAYEPSLPKIVGWVDELEVLHAAELLPLTVPEVRRRGAQPGPAGGRAALVVLAAITPSPRHAQPLPPAATHSAGAAAALGAI